MAANTCQEVIYSISHCSGFAFGVPTAPVDDDAFAVLGDDTDRSENPGNGLISKLRFYVHTSPKICNSYNKNTSAARCIWSVYFYLNISH